MALFFSCLFALAYLLALAFAPALPDRLFFAAPLSGLLALLFVLAHVSRKARA